MCGSVEKQQASDTKGPSKTFLAWERVTGQYGRKSWEARSGRMTFVISSSDYASDASASFPRTVRWLSRGVGRSYSEQSLNLAFGYREGYFGSLAAEAEFLHTICALGELASVGWKKCPGWCQKDAAPDKPLVLVALVPRLSFWASESITSPITVEVLYDVAASFDIARSSHATLNGVFAWCQYPCGTKLVEVTSHMDALFEECSLLGRAWRHNSLSTAGEGECPK